MNEHEKLMNTLENMDLLPTYDDGLPEWTEEMKEAMEKDPQDTYKDKAKRFLKRIFEKIKSFKIF